MTLPPYEIGPIPERPPVVQPPVVEPQPWFVGTKAYKQLRSVTPGIPDELFNIYYQAWIETGDANLALAAMRASPRYDEYFAGNRREDGTLRYDELTYNAIVEDFSDTLRNVAGVNPDLFRSKFGDLIAGNKSPDEFFSQVSALVERVVLDAPEVLQQYSAYWGIEATTEGLIAMALDPEMDELVLNQQITMAEIAAEGTQRGFSIDKDFAASLFNADLNEQAAADFFGEAGAWVPVLNVLAARHADPDDEFDLTSFAASEIFDDPTQRQRMRRLVSQERASFITTGGFGVQTAEKTGGLSGLGRR